MASDWMASLPGELPLRRVTMPGTHNSASYAIRSGHLRAVVVAARCQSRNLAAQLDMGVRFLDLRVLPSGALCHGPISCEGSLESAFDTCTGFLDAHPGEALLVRVKDEAGRSGAAVEELVCGLAQTGRYPLHLRRRSPTVAEARGRIVLLCDWAGAQIGLPWAGGGMCIQDDFWQTSGRRKWSIVQEGLNRAASSTAEALQVSFTSATGLPTKSPLDIARRVNPLLSNHLLKSAPGFLGVIVMDFPSAFLCELIVRRNCAELDPCRAAARGPACEPAAADWLHTLRGELSSAAERADAAASAFEGAGAAAARSWPQPGCPEDYQAKVRWLGYVYSELLVARAKAEIGCPSLELPSPAERASASEAAEGPRVSRVLSERLRCAAECAAESAVTRLVSHSELTVMDDWVTA